MNDQPTNTEATAPECPEPAQLRGREEQLEELRAELKRAEGKIMGASAESPQARLEILELPAVGDGPPPFALILSGYSSSLTEQELAALDQFRRDCCASAIFITPVPIEVW